MLAADRVASKRTRAWKRKCGRCEKSVQRRTSRSGVAARAKDSCICRRSGRPHVASGLPVANRGTSSELPEPAECLHASESRRGPQALAGLPALRPATPTALVGELAAAGRLDQKESSRAPAPDERFATAAITPHRLARRSLRIGFAEFISSSVLIRTRLRASPLKVAGDRGSREGGRP